nr:hypothetical protein BaRGS_022365 [Batillaria attramentaria]
MVPSVNLQIDLNVTGDWNVTDDWTKTGGPSDETTDYYYYYDSVVKTMWQVMCPTVLLLGTFGNSMIILVLSKMVAEASAFPLLFMGLAVSDLILLWVVVFPRWLGEQFEYWIADEGEAACKIMTWLEYTFVSLSAWLLAAMTAQRAVNIVWPLFRMRYLRPRLSAVVTIAVLVGASLIFNSFTLHSMTVVNGTCWWSSEFENHVRLKIDWIEIVLNGVLPSIVMVICNCLMIHAVIQSAQNALDRCSATRPGMASRVTVTLIVVSLTFIVLTLPFYIMQMIQQRNPELEFNGPYVFFFNLADVMWSINSAINFFLYIMTGAKFREEAKKLFRSGGSCVRTTITSESSNRQSTQIWRILRTYNHHE